MTSFYVEMTFEMDGTFDEAMRAHLDDVAEALADITDVDGDVGVDIAAGRVDLCMTLDADDRVEAITKAFVTARTAVHTAGGSTNTWDNWLPRLLDSDGYRVSVAPSAIAH